MRFLYGGLPMKMNRIVVLCLLTLSLLALTSGLAGAGGMTRHIYNHSYCDLEFRATPRKGDIHFNGVPNSGRVAARSEGHYGVSGSSYGTITVSNSCESITIVYGHYGGSIPMPIPIPTPGGTFPVPVPVPYPEGNLSLRAAQGDQFNFCIKGCHIIRFYLNNPVNGDINVYTMDDPGVTRYCPCDR